MFRTGLLIFVLASCSSKQRIKEQNIEIVIDDAQSYSYNLVKKTYTVHNFTRPDTTIHFNLTDQQKQQIADKYYDLAIDELRDKQDIEDNCRIMPKLYTTLTIRCGARTQKFVIDEECKDYKGLFNAPGKKIKAFLVFVRKLLANKPEIRNAPTSDIMYL